MNGDYIERLAKYRRNKKRTRKELKKLLEEIVKQGDMGLPSEVYDIIEALGIPLAEVRQLLKELTMENKKFDKSKILLEQACRKYGVEVGLVENIIEVEKNYQLKDKRMGIHDKLREIIEQ